MSNERVDRARRALGADRVVALPTGPAKGPLDLLHQRDEVARLLEEDAERRGVIVLATPPLVFAAASLRPTGVEPVRSDSA